MLLAVLVEVVEGWGLAAGRVAVEVDIVGDGRWLVVRGVGEVWWK